jgi:hypothetical protein
MATSYRGLFGGGTTRRRRGVRIEDVRGTYNPAFGSGVAAAARAARGSQQARDTSIARAAQAAGRSASSAGSGSGGAGRSSTRLDASGAARAANQAAAAIRRQVARGSGQTRSAPVATPRSGPAHRTLPNPVPGSTGTGRLVRPVMPRTGQPDASRIPRPPAAPAPRTEANRSKPGTLRTKAAKAKVDPGSFDKDLFNRAVSRFVSTHKWARQAGQEDAVRQAVAYLLSKEHRGYREGFKKRKGEDPRAAARREEGR